MDLKTKKQEVEKMIAQNKIEQANHQQIISNLTRGADYLKGQSDLLDKMAAEQAKLDEEENADAKKDLGGPNGNVSTLVSLGSNKGN